MIQIGPYIITESETVDTLVITGRFQPFTKGHMKIYESAKKYGKKYRNIIIGVVTRGNPKIDSKNPFTDKERIMLIKKALPGVKIIKVPSLYYESIWDVAGKEVAIGIGADREPSLQKMGGKKDGTGKFEYFVIPRPPGAISATMVRQALLDDDEKLFRKITPSGIHSEYDWMRERILEVNRK